MLASTTQQPATAFRRLARWAPFRFLCYAAAIVATAVVAKILSRLLIPPAPSTLHAPLMVVKNLLLPIAMFAVYAALVRIIEHRNPSEIDVRAGASQFLVGLIVGSLLMIASCVVLFALGMATFSRGTGLDGLTVAIVYHLATAMGEELLFRAVLFRITEEVAGTTVAIGFSAAIFGLMHLANPGATAFGITALSVECGVMLALAYALTRNLWLAIGIHWAWNFTQGYVLGVDVSGVEQPYSILKTTFDGPDLLTGGSFGPEASIVTLSLCLIASAALAARILRSGNGRSLQFRLRT